MAHPLGCVAVLARFPVGAGEEGGGTGGELKKEAGQQQQGIWEAAPVEFAVLAIRLAK